MIAVEAGVEAEAAAVEVETAAVEAEAEIQAVDVASFGSTQRATGFAASDPRPPTIPASRPPAAP